MKRENQIGCRVSFPSSYFMELEDIWKHAEGGCHRAQPFQDFLNMLVGLGLEAYRNKLLPRQEEVPADERTDPADVELEEWGLGHGQENNVLRYRV
ncbi:hypothetical protein AGMMS49942_29040 [Spirochaetia bacterium]|nr:hypothetical protein AGMMS49942_29040 [Spirochaetia bacterium]